MNDMEYIVMAPRIETDSNFKLTLEQVCRNESAVFRSASTDLEVTDNQCMIKICRSTVDRNVAHSFRQTRSKVTLKLLSEHECFILSALTIFFGLQ